jgi:hypothetical protein
MFLQLHPSAKDNFDAKAEQLVSLVSEKPELPRADPAFQSDLLPSATITEADVIGEITESDADYRGRDVAKYFRHDGKRFGLDKADFQALADLAEAIQSLPALRSILSGTFVEQQLFGWIADRYKLNPVPESFCAFLDAQSKDSVKSVTIWIPIANLEIEKAFPIASSQLLPLSSAIISGWTEKFPQTNPEARAAWSKTIDRFRKDFQGRAAVQLKVSAEPQRALELAQEEADKATALLGIVSTAMHIPDIKCLSRPKGSEGMAIFNAILEGDYNNFNFNRSIVDKGSTRSWRMDAEEIRRARIDVIDQASAIIGEKTPTQFKKTILNALFLYANAAFTAEPVEKLVYILSSLESVLLRNETEPIQQNLGERMAVLLYSTLEARKEVIKTIRQIYGVRSQYLHHGHSRSELTEVRTFLGYAWWFFVQLLANSDRFSEKEKFLNAIDDKKLG